MGIETSLIVFASLAIVAFIVVLIVALLDREGILHGWNKKKKVPTQDQYPCNVNGECGANYGLGVPYICDPKLKQCRIKAYIGQSCKSDDDCMQITPSCLSGLVGGGRMCSHKPYSAGNLFGDPTGGCGQLVATQEWNFCQLDISAACTTTDECGNGVCTSGTCQFLKPFDVCTVGSSYATQQCNRGQYCASGEQRLDAHRCQRDGVVAGQSGAFCATDSDCNNGDCYRSTASDPIGICANAVALIGMSCRNGGECAPGLDCSINSGATSGTCVLLDPTQQTNQTHCPPGYTTIFSGCAGANKGVPCSSNQICNTSSQCNVSPGTLVLGSLGANQSWNTIYPGLADDATSFFTQMFTGTGNAIALNPDYALLISIAEFEMPEFEYYPMINLIPYPPPTVLPPPQPPAIRVPRACQPITADLSLFANASGKNVVFQVRYNPLSPATGQITTLFLGSTFTLGQTVVVTKSSKDLYTDFLVDQNPYGTPLVPYTQTYIYCNYHGRRVAKTWTPSEGDTGNVNPIASYPNWPDRWLRDPSGSPTTNPVPQIIPPPMIGYFAQYTGSFNYLQNCLRFGEDDPVSREPVQVYAHFFYYPSGGERVISWKFSVMPIQGSGGLVTLIGLYEVERHLTVGSGFGRRLVVSTMTLSQANPTQLQLSSSIVFRGTTLYPYRKDPFYSNVSSITSIYASIYSFVLIDFETNWPFSTRLRGPPTTVSDVAGLCNVKFSDTRTAVSTFENLAPNGSVIPGWNLEGHNIYPIFTPRAYTRVQAATTVRNFVNPMSPGVGQDTQWTSMTLFGSLTPSLLDSDLVVIGTAGESSIVALSLVYSHIDTAVSPQTLLLTMRFGDCLPTGRYSVNNLEGGLQNQAWPTRSFTFYLTPEPEETGGDDILRQKVAFPNPRTELVPTTTTDISSWATGPAPSQPLNTPESNATAEYVSHRIRTPWGSEVFTASLIPEALSPPVRFFRMPVSAQQLSAQGADDVWLWGQGATNSLVAVPLFFDNLGAIYSTFPDPVRAQWEDRWLSTAGTACPPSVQDTVAGQDYVFTVNTPAPNTTYVFSQDKPWNIAPSAVITFHAPTPPMPLNPIPLVGRLCQTQGYQDGLLYRTRPYVFPPTSGDTNLPTGIKQLFDDPNSNSVTIKDVQSATLAFCSLNPVFPYAFAVPYLGLASITAMLGPVGSIHPTSPNFFDNSNKEIIWVGSESGVPILPGGYRIAPCPLNPSAFPVSTQSSYPLSCPDINYVGSPERKPLPICIVYHDKTTRFLEMRLYDVRMVRGTTGYSVQVVSTTPVQMNGGLVLMQGTGGSQAGYPGFNGGPTVVYKSCE